MKISVIIPAHNEEKNILAVIHRVRQSALDLPVEMVVVDGQSSDRTVELAKTVADLVVAADAPSRGHQLHLGAQKASGDVFVFLHADTILPENWQQIILREFLDHPQAPAVGMFQLRFDSDQWVYRLIEALANLRANFTKVYHGDQAWVLRRETYFACGGFADVPLMEEYVLMPKLRRLGAAQLFSAFAVTSRRKYLHQGPLRNALRNSFFILLYYLGVSPRTLAAWYRWRRK